MNKLQFVSCHDPILNSIARPLTLAEIKTKAMQDFFADMTRFARGEQGNLQKHVLVGLAAPQIGQDIRVILVDIKADGKGGVADLCLYINPEIVNKSDEHEVWYEGCYSTGRVKGIVKRPKRVIIKALNRDGNLLEETHTGYVARIFQHEIDHLDGIRFPERMEKDQMIHIVHASEMALYRNEQAWKNWRNTVPLQEWKKNI